MSHVYPVEIYWLGLTILFTAVMWVPYILNRIVELGVIPALLDPQGDTLAKAQWANRMMAAHVNAVENLVLFAPLVLIVAYYELGNEQTVLAVQIYFYARVLHFFLFTFAVPFFRIAAFLAGFAAQVMLLLSIL